MWRVGEKKGKGRSVARRLTDEGKKESDGESQPLEQRPNSIPTRVLVLLE